MTVLYGVLDEGVHDDMRHGLMGCVHEAWSCVVSRGVQRVCHEGYVKGMSVCHTQSAYPEWIPRGVFRRGGYALWGMPH